MDAGRIYEALIGILLVSGGTMFVCIDLGVPRRSERIRKAGEAMPMKKTNPVLFSLLGPITLILGLAQLLRQLHLFR